MLFDLLLAWAAMHIKGGRDSAEGSNWLTPLATSLKIVHLSLQTKRLDTPGTDNTHTHTHPFNGPLSRTTRVSQCQKGKTNLDFSEARDSEWQWHQPVPER